MLDLRIGVNEHIVNSEADIVGVTNKCYISLEVNYNESQRLDNKNLSYMCQLILKQLDKSSDEARENKYSKLLPINQICLNNYDRFGKKEFIYHSMMMEESYHIPRSNLHRIIDINVDFLTQMGYNEIVKMNDDSLEKLLYIFICDNANLLDKVYLNNEIMDKVRRKLINLSKNLDEYLYYDLDEIKRLDAYDLGRYEGFEQGTETTKEDMIKTMHKNGADVESIHKLTEISLEKIKETLSKISED